jgi:O-antigen/teichoic acid export membrane protein
LSDRSLLSRLAARVALPIGSIPVGIGLVVSGVTTYAFLAMSGRALGPEKYASLSALWGLVFLVAPGAYVPFEQELGRAVAARRSAGIGIGPVVRRVSLALAVVAGVVVLGMLASGPAVVPRLFDDQRILLLAAVLTLALYPVSHVVKGVLAGTASFGGYGQVQAAEGVARVALCVGFVVLGFDTAGPFGLAIAAGPAASLLFLPRILRLSHEEGEPVAWSEVSTAIGYLFVGSLFSAVLLNAGPVAAKALASDSENELVGRFLATLVVARVPLFLFQAVQVALLPRLASLFALGMVAEFRAALTRVVRLVGVIGIGGTAGVVALGPPVIGLVFGEDFVVGRGHMLLLGLATTMFLLGLVFAQALIAAAHHARMALSWLIGAAVFLALLAIPFGLLLRVELALVGGGAAAAVLMALGVRRLEGPEAGGGAVPVTPTALIEA